MVNRGGDPGDGTRYMNGDFGPEDEDYEDWVVCWQCGGEGYLEDCFEDCCVCLDPPCHTPRCDICLGKGGWVPASGIVTEGGDAPAAPGAERVEPGPVGETQESSEGDRG